MMICAPDLVDTSDLASLATERVGFLKAGHASYRWRPFFHTTGNGVSGVPENATAEKGEKLLEVASDAIAALILDEATSNIDANIEKRIQETIKKNGNGTTTLIIAHRLSNVREADRILVIHKGEISESGTHDSLLEQKGIYFNLYNLQNEIRQFSALQT